MIAASTRTPTEVLDNILIRIAGVQYRGRDRYAGFCSAHNDRRHQSLSITPGDRGILLKCWTGCTVKEICAAIGLTESDLFYDSPASRQARAARPIPERPPDWRRTSTEQLHRRDALDLRTDRTLTAATDVDPFPLTDDETHMMLNAVADAYADRDLADRLEQAAFQLREEGLRTERERYALRSASRA